MATLAEPVKVKVPVEALKLPVMPLALVMSVSACAAVEAVSKMPPACEPATVTMTRITMPGAALTMVPAVFDSASAEEKRRIAEAAAAQLRTENARSAQELAAEWPVHFYFNWDNPAEKLLFLEGGKAIAKQAGLDE